MHYSQKRQPARITSEHGPVPWMTERQSQWLAVPYIKHEAGVRDSNPAPRHGFHKIESKCHRIGTDIYNAIFMRSKKWS